MYNKNVLNNYIYIIEILSILILVLVILFSIFLKIPFDQISANPLVQYKAPLYMGLLNRIGIIFWCGTVFVTLFSYLYLNLLKESSKDMNRFFLSSCLFFGYFLLDELFLLHGVFIPKVIGIHQLIVLIIYAFSAFCFVIYFRLLIIKSGSIFFLAAISLLGGSVIVDILSYLKILDIGFRYILDDGLKYLGILTLFIYYLKTSLDSLLAINIEPNHI